MTQSRRRFCQAVGVSTLAGFAGCTTTESLLGDDDPETYQLELDPFGKPLVESTLYEPSSNEPFAEPAETALEAVLPDGEHTTYGFKPVPDEAYVEHDGQYFQLTYVISGRREIERDIISVEPIEAESELPDEPPQPDEFSQSTERVLTVLHVSQAGGADSPLADELDNGRYVLRRPAEREGQLATGELDETVFSMTDGTAFAYRIHRTTSTLREPRYVLRAIEVADSEIAFTETLRATEIDVELNPDTLTTEVNAVLAEATGQPYTEARPISDAFDATLKLLDVDTAELPVFNATLWYDEQAFRYSVTHEESA